MSSRTLLIAFTVFVLAAIGTGIAILLYLITHRPPPAERRPDDPVGMLERRRANGALPDIQPVFSVEDVPLPTELPFLPLDADDEDAVRVPDVEALIALLNARRFEDLTRYLEAYESAVRDDLRKDAWAAFAIDALGAPVPARRALLDEWLAASPESFAPRTAIAAYHHARGARLRGSDFAFATSDDRLAAARAEYALAAASIRETLDRPTASATVAELAIYIGNSTSDDELIHRAASVGARACPACYRWRLARMFALRPIWGGSLEAMRRFDRANRQHLAENPRLGCLRDWIAFDEADGPRLPASAGVVLARSLVADGVPRGIASQGASDALGADDDDALRFFVEQLRRLDPVGVETLSLVAQEAWRREAWPEMYAAIERLGRIDPTHPDLRRLLDTADNRLARALHDAAVVADREAFERAERIATRLVPEGPEVTRWRGESRTLLDRTTPIVAAMRANPDDRQAVKQYDDCLVDYGDWDRIIAAWTAYLVRHPDDPVALDERGGAEFNGGKFAEARRDAQRACDLGHASGCEHVRVMSARGR